MIDVEAIETTVDVIADQYQFRGGGWCGPVHIPAADAPEGEQLAALSALGDRLAKVAGLDPYGHPNNGRAVGFAELMRGFQVLDRLADQAGDLANSLQELRHWVADELVGGSESQLDAHPLLELARAYAAVGLEQKHHG